MCASSPLLTSGAGSYRLISFRHPLFPRSRMVTMPGSGGARSNCSAVVPCPSPRRIKVCIEAGLEQQ